MTGLRRLRPSASRKHRTFADGSGNAPYRPWAALWDRPYKRAVSARKRSSA